MDLIKRKKSSLRTPALESAAMVGAVAAGAGCAAGIVRLASGGTAGAPGISHAFSRLGRLVGGRMTTGVAVAGAGAALAGIAAYKSIKAVDGR